MSNEELNKKLAEWAGFKDAHIDDLGHPIYRKVSVRTGADWEWAKIPDFTNSLDTCFKWLVPKLTVRYPLIHFNTNDDNYSCCSIGANGNKYFSGWGTPALALCKAIEQLIDKESKP